MNLNIIPNEQDQLSFSRIPFIFEGAGINLDLLNESHKSMSSELICSICLEMVFNPVMCAKCENLFCKDCIAKQLTKSNKCPNQCIYVEKEIGRVLKNVLNKFEIKCFYFKRGCNEIVLYSNYVKHVTSCDYGDFKCNSPNCSYTNVKAKMLEHVALCEFRLTLCKYCNLKIPRVSFTAHFEECANIQIPCKSCKNTFTNRTLADHIESCEFVEVNCPDCNSYIKKKDFSAHDKVACLTSQLSFWQGKYSAAEKIIDELTEKLKESEKKNKNFLNFSAKLFESQSAHNNSMFMHNNIPGSGSFIPDYFDSIQNEFLEFPEPGSMISQINQINQMNINLADVDSKYRADVVDSLGSLSGLVYSIVDLELFQPGLACCGNFSSILVFSYLPMKKEWSLDGHSSYIWNIVHLYQYNVNFIASGSQDNTIKIWDLSLKSCVRTLTGHENWVTTVTTFQLNPMYLLSTSYDHSLRIWDITNGSCARIFYNVSGKFCANAYYANEAYILYGSTNNNITVYDFTENSVKFHLKGHTNLINCFINLGEFDKNYVASGSDDRTIKVWNLETGGLVRSLSGHGQCITFLQHLIKINETNSIMASGSDDHTIRLWCLITFQCVTVLKIHESWVKSLIQLKNPELSDYVLSHGDAGVIKLTKLVKIK